MEGTQERERNSATEKGREKIRDSCSISALLRRALTLLTLLLLKSRTLRQALPRLRFSCSIQTRRALWSLHNRIFRYLYKKEPRF